MSAKSAISKNWKRVMYEKQSYKDNYVDPTNFFDQLKLTHSHTSDSFGSAFMKATVIIEQFLVVTLFLTTYKILLEANIVLPLLAIECFLLAFGLVLHRILDASTLFVFETIQNTFLFGVCLRILAPILKSLTLSFSSNTIHAVSITLSVVHLASFNFGNQQGSVSETLSLNAALFLAIILASRFAATEVVVVFLLLAVLLFFLLPKTTKLIRTHSTMWHVVLTGLVWMFQSVLLVFVDKALFVLFEAVIISLWVLGPHLFLRMHAFKGTLSGPWDIQWI